MRRDLGVPTLMFAQTAAPAAKPPPLTAGSSGSYPVMSTAVKNRARQLFGYLESGQTTQLTRRSLSN